MRLDCPNGHAAVIRHDPDSTGLMGQCDTCGWTATYQVVLDAQAEERNGKQLPKPSRGELAAAGGEGRKGDHPSRRE